MERNNFQKNMQAIVRQVIKMINLADYQERAVVSRTIIDKKTGTVTFFCF